MVKIPAINSHVVPGFVTEPEDSKDPQNETQTSSKKRISKEEYVGIIVDILKLRKNVCLCRHFQSLNKDSLFSLERKSVFDPKTPKKLYIDVWLVDFFSPSYTNVCDTSSLFILQLVNITLSMYVGLYNSFFFYSPDFFLEKWFAYLYISSMVKVSKSQHL